MKMNSADIIIRRYLFIDVNSLSQTRETRYYYRTKIQQFGETKIEFGKNVLQKYKNGQICGLHKHFWKSREKIQSSFQQIHKNTLILQA